MARHQTRLAVVAVVALSLCVCCGIPSMLSAPKRKRLFEASRTGDTDQVRTLLDRGLDVDTEGFYGARALKIAASYGQCGVLETLLGYGATTDDIGAELALRNAISGRHACAVELLLRAGVDPNANYYLGGTPLMRAAEQGNVEVIELLLEHGADPNARGRYADPPKKPTVDWYNYGIREKECEGTALILASRRGSAEVVQLLLAHGAQADLSDSHGCTPLMAATQRGNLAVVAALMAAGAEE